MSGTDAQTALLMSIKADIQIILKAPLKAAVTWIEQAELTEPGSKYRTQYLDKAWRRNPRTRPLPASAWRAFI